MNDTCIIDLTTLIIPRLTVLEAEQSRMRAWHSTVVSTLSEAELYLDQTEAAGYLEQALAINKPDHFIVRWR